MATDKSKTDDAAPISDVFLKHRRRVYAWRGAVIGAVLGILMVGGMTIFFTSHTPDAIEARGDIEVLLGAPANTLFRILLPVFGPRIDISLGIPLNWAMFGFVIGWLVGNARNPPQDKIL